MFWNWESTFELWKLVDFDDHVDLYKRSSKGKQLTTLGAQMGDRYYIRLEEKQKNKKLFDLLDTLEFNQAVSGPKQIPGFPPEKPGSLHFTVRCGLNPLKIMNDVIKL